LSSPTIISIVGLSGSGKTTLVVKLVEELTGRGIKVGTIKHSRHVHTMDVPGKDSWRHKEAGAIKTLFVGPETMQLVSDVTGDESPFDFAKTHLGGLDIALVEGFLSFKMDKIEVVRKERSTKPVTTPDDGLVAIASDINKDSLGDPGVPVMDLDATEAIADFIVSHLKVKRS
jgi:molybdopterin-guanine dinucleotide biosynthesis protein B